MSISVVIPVKNGELFLNDCITAILSQTLKPVEIIIVDAHSSDKTIQIAEKFPVTIYYEDYGTRGGGREVGVQHAKGDYIAFIDVDCIPDKYWLENLSKVFEGNIVGVGGSTKNIGEGIWERSISAALDTFLGSANSIQDRYLKGQKIVKSISGCNCMYKKSDLIKIGGFDTTLTINEDTELNKRIRIMGNLLYTSKALVYHNQKRNLTGFIKRMYSFGYSRGSNKLYDLQVIPPFFGLVLLLSLIVTPIFFLSMILLYAFLLIVYSLDIVITNKNIIYFITVPIVYVTEHFFYSLGLILGSFNLLKNILFKNININKECNSIPYSTNYTTLLLLLLNK